MHAQLVYFDGGEVIVTVARSSEAIRTARSLIAVTGEDGHLTRRVRDGSR